ncbi:DNA-binding protein [Enterovirga sp. CN4-39]|uniref:DNA-binding protein n=1 Tax=Enterovirga sp. CN4-39 TaxID=3400910 RepID=UPI003C0BD224
MPTRSEVERAARELRRAGERVSVRNVRRKLPKGGSYGSIGPLLAQWKVDADYRPGKLPSEVPAGLTGAVNAFVAQVWAAARVEADKVVEAERKRLELLERVHEREAIAAWAEVDRLNEVVTDLTLKVRQLRWQVPRPPPPAPPPETPEQAEEFERLRGFVGSLPGDWLRRGGGVVRDGGSSAHPARDAEMESLLRPLEARWATERAKGAFWDGVMQEAAAVIAASKDRALGVAEILAGLSSGRRTEAVAHGGLDEAVLRREMQVRVDGGRSFRLLDDGRFGLLEDGGSPGRIEGPGRRRTGPARR